MSDVDKLTFTTTYDKQQDIFCFEVEYNQAGPMVSLGLTGKVLLEMLLELGSVVKDQKTKSVSFTFKKEQDN